MLLLVLNGMGCATHESWKTRAKRWGLRGVGGVVAYAVHEGCHLALGAAVGADISARFEGTRLILGFSDISPAAHQGVAFAGMACTGIVSELLVDFGKHKTNDIAWGFAAFHAFNSLGYAFAGHGDARHFQGAGGSQATWMTIHSLHGARIAGQLGWDSAIGDYVIRVWRGPNTTRDHEQDLPRGNPRADSDELPAAIEADTQIASVEPSYDPETFEPSFENALETKYLPEGWEPPTEQESWALTELRLREEEDEGGTIRFAE
jgi:hypothetical protein